MPRIMSRSHSLYSRRSSLGSRKSSSSSTSSSSSSSCVRDSSMHGFDIFRWLQAPHGVSSAPSTSSSMTNSPAISRIQGGFPHDSLQQQHKRWFSEGEGCWMDANNGESDYWGQFIDTAEAENEIIRHSRILSKRYSIN